MTPQDRCSQATILLWGLYVGFSTDCRYLHVRLAFCELNARSSVEIFRMTGTCDLFSYVESYGALVLAIIVVGTAYILVYKKLVY